MNERPTQECSPAPLDKASRDNKANDLAEELRGLLAPYQTILDDGTLRKILD